MYLLVFVTLVVALTGIYGQVLAVQTKQLYANQAAIAGAMEAWHNSAFALAKAANPAINNATVNGCSLTNPSPGAALCSNGANVTLGAGTWPPGNRYTFYSLDFLSAGHKYIVTYVPQPNAAGTNPFIAVPGNGGTTIGITMSDLLTQIKNSGQSAMYYGTVNAANTLVAGSISNGNVTTQMSYTLPVSVPANAIAIISQVN